MVPVHNKATQMTDKNSLFDNVICKKISSDSKGLKRNFYLPAYCDHVGRAALWLPIIFRRGSASAVSDAAVRQEVAAAAIGAAANVV